MRDSGPKAQQILRFVREVTRDSAAVLARTQQLLPRPTVGDCVNNGKDAVRAVARSFFEVVTLGRHGVGDMGDADDAALERVRDAGGTVVMATQSTPTGIQFAYIADPTGAVLGVWKPPAA